MRATPKLAEERVLRGMTQDDLARRMNVDQSWVSTIENGRRSLGPRGAAKLGKALGLTVRRMVQDGLLIVTQHDPEEVAV